MRKGVIGVKIYWIIFLYVCIIVIYRPKKIKTASAEPIECKVLNTGAEYLADKINDISRLNDICYFIIMGIDDVSNEEQNRYVGLIKDREMNGYFLPNNCIIVLTVKNKDSLRKVSAELNHFAVVAI